MSNHGPFFHAWCPDSERVAAYAAALSALLSPKWWSGPPTREELVEKARAEFAAETTISDSRSYQLLSKHLIHVDLEVCRDSYKDSLLGSPLLLDLEQQFELLVLNMPMARVGPRSVEIESAIFSIVTFEDTIDLLRRLCAPDETSRVTTGACHWGLWESPLDGCITYNADANVARDLAAAWLNGYDKSSAVQSAWLDLRELQARIAAATAPRAQVAQASMVEFVEKYSVTVPRWAERNWGVEFAPPPAYELAREQVLAVLETPPARLLEVLETAAIPDAEWRAVEPIARENIEAKKRGAPCDDVPVRSRPHLRFLEQHAPFHVRRLHNGGVMIGTHPYRTLWPLWASALELLGIRPATA